MYAFVSGGNRIFIHIISIHTYIPSGFYIYNHKGCMFVGVGRNTT